AVLTLENQRAVIQQLVARSDGTITASGAIEFRDLNRPILNVTANLNGFRAARVEAQEPARVDGQAQVTGPFDAAVLTGNVELSDGYFPVPTVFSSPLDDELELLAEPGAAEKTSNRPRASSFVENLRIDNFHLRAGESLWFAMPDARAELEGELVVDKQGDDMRITGELHGTRGQYTLRAGPIVRRFDVVEASIRFLGDTEINPVINITASREIIDPTGGTMDIRVIVRGTMRSPTLALASGNAANIPQSELLSILLFGRAQVGLAGGGAIPGQAIVTETFVGGLGELLSMELEDELIDAGVSLDIFQLRFGNSIANLYQPSIVIGEEVGNNLFITVESGLGSLFNGDQGSIIPTLRLEWRMNPTTRMSLAYEPVYPWRALRGITVAQPLLNTQQNRQWKFDIKKRWSW
ncbi:MAG TPA: translocation/assembly module TamB domain-containing protein, partial [Longimicrobiales bacterium]